MNGNWSLDALYPSYDSPAYQADVAQLEATLQSLGQLELLDELTTIRTVISQIETINVLAHRLFAFSHLQLATNTSDSESLQRQAYLSRLMATHAKTIAQIDRFLGNCTTDITQDDTLKHYTFAFQQFKQQAQYLLSDEVEEVLSLLNQSAGDAWENLQSYLTSTIEGEFDGKPITLSEIRNLAYDADPSVRQRAYEQELAMYQTIKEPIAFALNNIKSQVNDISKLRGFSSPLEATLIQSRMSQATLDALLAAIEESLPAFRRYLKHKAHLLGHENGLPFYDLFAPIGQASTRTFSAEEAKDYLIEHFSKFSDDLAEMTREFFEQDYIDLYPRKGKVGGAFCSNLPFIKQSRVLMNFDGSLRNVVTLAHELGHAYHGLHIEEHAPLNRHYTMPVAETASTFNENLIMSSIIKEASDAEKISLLESEIQDTTQLIVDIYSRYLFESSVFSARQERFMFANELEELMLDAQRQAYGDGLDQSALHPYMWLCKGHYYSTGLSFYNFPYAFGGLFAKGLYAKYQAEPNGFVANYQAMLHATTVSTVEETGRTMGIDLTKKEFWALALQQIEQQIDEFIRLTSQN